MLDYFSPHSYDLVIIMPLSKFFHFSGTNSRGGWKANRTFQAKNRENLAILLNF